MPGFRDITIRRKLVIIQGATAFIVVLLCCVFFVINAVRTFKDSTVRKMYSIVRIVGENSVSPLLFLDEEAENKILQNLDKESDIMEALVFDKTGRVFSRYKREGVDTVSLPELNENLAWTSRFIGEKLFVSYRIFQDQEFLGTVVIRAELTELNNIILNYIKIAAAVLLVALLGAILISIFFQRAISNRLLALVSETKKVARTGNYSLRVDGEGRDEIAILGRGVNNMLSQIEKMEISLRETNLELEQRIAERTVELVSLNKELESNVRQLAEREEQVNTIFGNAPDPVVVINSKGEIVKWNGEAEKTFGWKAGEVLGKAVHEVLIPERFREAHQRGLAQFLKTGVGAVLNRTIELPALRKDRSEIEMELNIAPSKIRDEYFFIAFLRDITERKKAEEKISLLNKDLEQNVTQLEAVNKELESFSYSVSHDLRAPLRAIHGYTKILLEDYVNRLDDDAQMMMTQIMLNAKKMGQLIDDLLAFSRIGKKELQKTAVDMTALAQSVADELINSIPASKVNVVIHPLPPALADYSLVRQVFVNLISNAIKYSQTKESPQVLISSEKKENEVVYFIKDNGVGFDMQYYDKLFGVFQRLHRMDEFEGTGVGLAIVKRIVNKHGGQVWAEAETGKGATFYFSLEGEGIGNSSS